MEILVILESIRRATVQRHCVQSQQGYEFMKNERTYISTIYINMLINFINFFVCAAYYS